MEVKINPKPNEEKEVDKYHLISYTIQNERNTYKN